MNAKQKNNKNVSFLWLVDRTLQVAGPIQIYQKIEITIFVPFHLGTENTNL